MKALQKILIALTLLLALPVFSEVGETNVIDAIATKPGSEKALLLLHQLRPWNPESVELLRKKLAFYSEAIKSKALIEQHPQLRGKQVRVVVLCDAAPSTEAQGLLAASKTDFQSLGASLVWGTQKQLIELAEQP